jgi:CMP-2-keto-3-deoxyoctulosonic acid synthetase
MGIPYDQTVAGGLMSVSDLNHFCLGTFCSVFERLSVLEVLSVLERLSVLEQLSVLENGPSLAPATSWPMAASRNSS